MRFILKEIRQREVHTTIPHMVPLSISLSELVIPHNSFYSHPAGNGESSNPKLGLKNFAKAEEILADICYFLIMECFVAEYIVLAEVSDAYHKATVIEDLELCPQPSQQESQYFLKNIEI